MHKGGIGEFAARTWADTSGIDLHDAGAGEAAARTWAETSGIDLRDASSGLAVGGRSVPDQVAQKVLQLNSKYQGLQKQLVDEQEFLEQQADIELTGIDDIVDALRDSLGSLEDRCHMTETALRACEKERDQLNEQLFRIEESHSQSTMVTQEVTILQKQTKMLQEEKSRLSIEVTQLEGMQEQMMRDINNKDVLLEKKDKELEDCYRRIKELSSKSAESSDRQLGVERKARIKAEEDRGQLQHEYTSIKTLVTIKEEQVQQLKRDLEQTLHEGASANGQRVRALQAEVNSLRDALAAALDRTRYAEEGMSRANEKWANRALATAKTTSARKAATARATPTGRKPPEVIKYRHHRFSEPYVQHILHSQEMD